MRWRGRQRADGAPDPGFFGLQAGSGLSRNLAGTVNDAAHGMPPGMDDHFPKNVKDSAVFATGKPRIGVQPIPPSGYGDMLSDARILPCMRKRLDNMKDTT